jgi:lysostaphin
MQIILVSGHLRQARSVTVKARHFVAAIGGVAALVVAMSAGMSYLTLASGIVARLPLGERMAAAIGASATSNEQYVRDNISALAMRLGEMQAQVTRLDAVGERLFALTGLKSREAKPAEAPGRGGTAVDAASHPLTLEELQRELDQVARQIDNRGDELKVLEEELVRERVRNMLLPSAAPLVVTYQVSGFGRRIDPFNGRAAMHEGIDFAAPTGTPILAAAAGFVITAEYHPSYGNMVEIDHGNGRTTRYAHASKLHVKVGERVTPGKRIADVGSTGSSTGPHLHFEVRENGVAQNPARFLLATR